MVIKEKKKKRGQPIRERGSRLTCKQTSSSAKRKERVTVLVGSPKGPMSIANVYVSPFLHTSKWYRCLSYQDMLLEDRNICRSRYPSRRETPGVEYEDYIEETESVVLNADRIPTHTESVWVGIPVTRSVLHTVKPAHRVKLMSQQSQRYDY